MWSSSMGEQAGEVIVCLIAALLAVQVAKIVQSVPPLYIYMQTRQFSVAEWNYFKCSVSRSSYNACRKVGSCSGIHFAGISMKHDDSNDGVPQVTHPSSQASFVWKVPSLESPKMVI